jgi:hypothetical protein
MSTKLPNFIGKFVEIVGVVTALVFVFEVTLADRTLPTIDLTVPETKPIDFFKEHNRTTVFVSLAVDRDMVASPETDLYADTIVLDTLSNLSEAILLVDWNSLSSSYLAEINDYRAEDLSFSFHGPAYARMYESEGQQYIELTAAPFTDSVADRAKCSELLKDKSGLAYSFRYIASCMLK